MNMKFVEKYLKKNLLLNQFNVRYVPPNTIVDTNFLGPCFGIIVHDKENKRAYAGHFPIPQDGSLVLLLNKAISELDIPQNLDVYCVGSSPGGQLEDLENQYVQYTLKEREFVTSTLEKYGFEKSKLFFRLTNKPEQYAKLKFDVDSGETEYFLFSNLSTNKKPIYKGNIFGY